MFDSNIVMGELKNVTNDAQRLECDTTVARMFWTPTSSVQMSDTYNLWEWKQEIVDRFKKDVDCTLYILADMADYQVSWENSI